MGLTEEQRYALKCELDRAVTASAGTGKTFVLTRRFVRSIDEGVSDIESMAAITFTELAASEMKRKVRDRVSSKADGGGADACQWDDVRDRLFAADIATIHAFCAKLLREHPIEAEVDPGFSVISGVEETALVEEALADVFDAAGDDKTVREHAATLLSHFDQRDIREMLLNMAQHRAVAKMLVDSGHFNSVETVLEHWKGVVNKEKRSAIDNALKKKEVEDALRTLADVEPETEGGYYVKFVSGARQFARDLLKDRMNVDALNQTPQLVTALFTGKKEYRKLNGLLRGSSFGAGEKEALELALQTLMPSFRPHLDMLNIGFDKLDRPAAESAHAIVGLYTAFLSRYEARKQERGGLDFADLLEKAQKLLTADENRELLEELQGRLRHLLVDEFQDTDPVQWSIVETLWDGGSDGRKLFIVGDPKQSIYAFRDADVTVFNDACEAIETIAAPNKPAGDKGDELSWNFRSLENIVAFVDRVFSQLLVKRLGEGFEAEYGKTPENKWKEEAPKGTVELLLPPVDGDDDKKNKGDEEEEDDPSREFAAVAERIRTIVDNEQKKVRVEQDDGSTELVPAKYEHFAILLQARTHLDKLQDALDGAKVPFTVYKGVGFYQSQEVRDIASLLAVLTDDRDAVALFAVLRGPLFALSDDAMVRAAADGGALTDALEAYSKATGDPDASRIKAALATLERWRLQLDRLPLDRLVSRALDETGAWAVYSSLPAGKQRVANIEKLLDQAREFELGGTEGAMAFLRLLDEQISTETKTGEAAAGADGGDAVRIMTVHAAKGLQFPVVVVPTLHRKSPPPKGFLLDGGIGPGLTGPDDAGDLQSSAAKKLIALRMKERAWAEHKRLFYVAATRAKDHLILSGLPHKLPDKRPPASAPLDNKTWLGWLFEAEDIWNDYMPESGQQLLDGLVTVVVPDPPVDVRVDEDVAVEAVGEDDPVLAKPRADDPALRSHELPPRIERISPSRLKDYLACPAAYWAKHVVRAPEPPSGGRGAITVSPMARGSVIHKALETCLGKTFDEETVNALCAQEGVKAEHRRDLVDEARKAVASFEASPVGVEALAVPTILREQRILFPSDRGPGKDPTIIECIIDLLFKDSEGRWHVVDYKTNNVDAGNCEERMRGTYAMQMALYQVAVAKTTDVSPEDVKATIFCTAVGKEVDMTADAATIQQTMDKTRDALDTIERDLKFGREGGGFAATSEGEREEHVCKGCSFRDLTGCGEKRKEG